MKRIFSMFGTFFVNALQSAAFGMGIIFVIHLIKGYQVVPMDLLTKFGLLGVIIGTTSLLATIIFSTLFRVKRWPVYLSNMTITAIMCPLTSWFIFWNLENVSMEILIVGILMCEFLSILIVHRTLADSRILQAALDRKRQELENESDY